MLKCKQCITQALVIAIRNPSIIARLFYLFKLGFKIRACISEVII
jgi:hypothetical protein